MLELVFATHNLNKLQEVQLLLPKGIKLLSLRDIGCNDPIPETKDTLEGNALLKVNYVLHNYGRNCFADDTGLLVDALNGAPGVYSARYAGTGNAKDNIQKLLGELENTTVREAHFKTVIALQISGNSHIFSGTAHGEITSVARGTGGFGYDPVFKPKGYQQTFAELPLTVKNSISHRSIAIKKLLEFLNNQVS